MNRLRHAAAIILLGVTAVAAMRAQTPPKRKPPVRSRPTATQIVVRDQSGTPVQGAHVVVSGAMMRELTTDANGIAALASMRDGSYRLRFEREGFIMLEREITVRNGQPSAIEVALNAAPPPPPPPRPEPTPTPTPAPVPGGRPATVSIPAFLDRNFIGRDPLKESVIGCTASSTTRLLQLRDPIAVHTHANLDEILYVVAGEGVVRIGNQVTAIGAASLSVIPRGTAHSIERRGRNPLVVISTLAGAPCVAGG